MQIVYVGEKGAGTAAALCNELHEDDRFVSINGTSTLQYDLDKIQDLIIVSGVPCHESQTKPPPSLSLSLASFQASPLSLSLSVCVP